jgi:broad specificity phosphatase PhoE
MDVDLLLVRHGRSEGNEAREQSKRGDNRAYTEAFRGRLNREWRLTDLGVEQARAAGRWIRRNIEPPYHRCCTSEYVRARETAAHLGLPDARWRQEILLRERSWGRVDFVMPESERYERFEAELTARRQDPCYWRPPEGESLAEVCLRMERVLDTVRGRPPGGNCIIVTHEDVMWAARFLLEGLTQEQWRELLLSDDPCTKLHNGQVLHYSRRDPETGRCSETFQWVRSVCPWDPGRSDDEWRRIRPRNFSNEELLAGVEMIPRLIAGPPVSSQPEVELSLQR